MSAFNLHQNPPAPLPWGEVKTIDHREVATWLGLEPLQERGKKFPCVWCQSTDALHIDSRRIRCYSCGEHGTNVDLVMQVRGCDNVAAVRMIAERFGIVALDGPSRWTAPVRTSPPRRPAPPEPSEERRAEWAEVYAAALEVLSLTDGAKRFLTDRGLAVHATATEYGFRGVDDRTGWEALYRALRDRFGEGRVLDALMPMKDDASGERHPLPWGGHVGALVIPYTFRGAVHALRFRRYVPRAKHDRYRDLGGRAPIYPFNADAMIGCAGETLWLCEGELDTFCAYGAANVRAIGLPGTGTPWRSAWSPYVRDVGQLIACYDGDKPGSQATAKLAELLIAEFGIDWVREHTAYEVPPDGMDLNDLLRAGRLHDFLS